MISLTAIIITFNEERNIERCLQSLQGVVDEIIVVDSFSTDATKDIVAKFNVTFVQRKWEGYAATKNLANTMAAHDLIFSIDADEEVGEDLKKSINAFKQQDEFEIAELNRLTNYCGSWIKHCGWYPDKKVRIFNRQNASWQGAIHETLTLPQHEKVYSLQGDLLHYSYFTKDDHFKQIEKFTDIAASELLQKGKRTFFLMPYFSGLFKFIQSYILQLGFLDGKAGYLVCTRSAFASYLKYYKLLKLQHAN